MTNKSSLELLLGSDAKLHASEPNHHTIQRETGQNLGAVPNNDILSIALHHYIARILITEIHYMSP